MRILAIDPGPERSAWVWYMWCDSARRAANPTGGPLGGMGISENNNLLAYLENIPLSSPAALAIEMPEGRGMPVGQSVLDTALWVGRFAQQWSRCQYYPWVLVYRRKVKLHICGDSRAKDSNIRQALIDRFGGSREKAIGTKKNPGPLYGVKRDIWQALALAITAAETVLEDKPA